MPSQALVYNVAIELGKSPRCIQGPERSQGGLVTNQQAIKSRSTFRGRISTICAVPAGATRKVHIGFKNRNQVGKIPPGNKVVRSTNKLIDMNFKLEPFSL